MSIKAVIPMEALVVNQLPEGKEWRYEPKWDGFRCLAHKQGPTVTLQSKPEGLLRDIFPKSQACSSISQLKSSSSMGSY